MFQRISDDISCCSCEPLSLSDFAANLPSYCSMTHRPTCSVCPPLLSVAQKIIEGGFVLLSQAFRSAFPHKTYHSHSAKCCLLQLPLVAMRVGHPRCGLSEVYLFEHSPNVNYQQFLHLLNAFHLEKSTKKLFMSKQQLQGILSIAKSDRERECIRYTAVVASGLSATSSRKHFGFERVSERVQGVDSIIKEVEAIRSAYESIAKVQEKVTFAQFGLECKDDSGSSTGSSESDSDLDSEIVASSPESVTSFPLSDIVDVLKAGRCNWFEVVSTAEEKGVDPSYLEGQYENVSSRLSEHELCLLQQSHAAYLQIEKDDTFQVREAAALNGYVVSESDSDNPDEYLPGSEAAVAIQKKVAAIRRKCCRDRAKAVSQKNYLGRRRNKKVRGILAKFPQIGKDIEHFVEERSIGADAWRRTGVLTFDGNKQVKEKVTYSRIRKHLEQLYNHKLSYGTVVQLCVARNRRRQSAARYKGVAKVTSRRARKGFQFRYNPDNHWSKALYRSLAYLQYSDGTNIVNINRDDAAGFRLDTLTTHRLHRTPVVQGKEILTTHTDYVNSYPSLLQTSSYNFSATETTGELCAGVVKGAGIFPKNAAQHAADLSMLESVASIQPAFVNPLTEKPKQIECIRVDGATDEGPSHQEVQFWWALRHLQRPTVITVVTTRNSGASYLNRVELQNGCLALAHANLFIPSNLNGSCLDPETGKIDQARLQRNMDQATDIYISRANGAPCCNTEIQLFKGADSTANQELRSDILVFLKGTKTQKAQLKRDKPERWTFMEAVWLVKSRHSVPNLPPQYVFFLRCCYGDNCRHPFCEQKIQLFSWFPDGPSVEYFPLPIPDPSHPWGSTECLKCPGQVCYGHFLTPESALQSTAVPLSKPPSQMIKEAFNDLKGKEPSDTDIQQLSKATLLPPGEVEIWLTHLQTIQLNRKRGAEKASATRRQKKGSLEARYFCVCGEEYTDSTDEIQHWIGCDTCTNWFHCECVGVNPASIPNDFVCSKCSGH